MRPSEKILLIPNVTKLIINILCIFSLACSSYAKTNIFTDIPSSGSLRTSTVHTFYKDSGQMLWIGTDKEIIAFDGNNSMHEALLDENSNPVVTYAFAETANSDIIAATRNGLYKVDFSSIGQKITPILSKKIKSANCLAVSVNDSILVGSDTGLYVVTPDLKDCYGPMLSSFKIKAIIPDGKHTFIATDQGVYSIDLATKLPTLIYGPINASDLLRESDRLYISSTTGELAIYDLTKHSAKLIDCGGVYINEIDNDSHGNIYIATDGDGVMMLEPNSTEPKPLHISRLKTNSDHNKQVYAIMVDKFDRVHVGYYLMGAEHSLLTNDAFSILDLPNGGNDISVRAVHIDGDDIMVGTREGAFLFNKNTGATKHLSKEQLGSGLVLAIEKFNGKYLIGTYGGTASSYDPITGALERHYTNNLHGSVFSMAKDRNGHLWLGTSSGAYQYDGEKVLTQIQSTEAADSLSNIYTVFFDSSGRGWAASAKGTYNIDTENAALRPSPITEKDVRQIYETRNHDLWVVTNAGKISVYNSKLQKSEINKLVSSIREARGVVEDKKGHIWITTANGLFKCSPFDEVLSAYGFADGIPSPMFNSGAPQISDDGILYLCHTEGLLQADTKTTPDGSLSHRKAHPAFLTGSDGIYMVRNKSTQDAYSIDLPSSQKIIRLSLTDAAFTDNSMARYEYSNDEGESWKNVDPSMNIDLPTANASQIDIKVRQIGNPLTETSVNINNPKSYSAIVWSLIAIFAILLISAGWIYTTILYKRKHAQNDMNAIDTKDTEQTANQAASINGDDGKPSASESESKKYSANYMSEKECAKIAKQVKTLLQETKIYTDPDLKIGTIAEKLGVTSHKLSYVFSQHLHTSYYDYIYEYRVEEFKRLAQADKKQTYTLVALSEKAGFNSRATFFRAFKKLEGVTPGDYLRMLRSKE